MGEEKVINKRKEMEIGDTVAKKLDQDTGGTVLTVVIGIFTIYGFVAFLNPERYPILGVLLKNTQFAYLGQYDSFIGIVFLVAGLVLLLTQR